MKKIRLLSLLWIILFAGTLAGCWSNKEVSSNDTWNNEWNNEWNLVIENTTSESDAVINYNDTLVDLASQCIISENNIWNSYDSESPIEDVQAAIKNTITECSNAKENVNKLWDWEWDPSLREWVVAIIDKEIAYYSKFNEILPYLEKEELTEDEKWIYDATFAEIQTLDEELSQANENLINVQEQFALNHWFELETDEVTE